MDCLTSPPSKPRYGSDMPPCGTSGADPCSVGELGVVAADDGDTVLVDFTGKSIRESPTHNTFVGENIFQKLAWLNGIKSRHEGEYNPVTGEQNLRVYAKR